MFLQQQVTASGLSATQSEFRVQFLSTPAGRYGLVRTYTVLDGKPILDTSGRRSFLAHGIILDPAEFARIDNQAMDLLEASLSLDPRLLVQEHPQT